MQTPYTSPAPTVISLQLHHTKGQPLRCVPKARALLQHGLEGDSHGKAKPDSRRQVLILDDSTLRSFSLAPGDLREQITIHGIPDISLLPEGQRLRIGDVTFEATGDCKPCLEIGEILGVDDNEVFRQELDRRRGLLCKVVGVEGEGFVHMGDAVQVL